jgi:hypothetical protein
MKMRSDQIVRGIILLGLLLVPMIVPSEAGILGKEGDTRRTVSERH